MNLPSDPHRRSFLLSTAALGLTQVLPPGALEAQTPSPHGFVLAPAEGEHLIHFRDRGNVFIKLGSATGSPNLAVGTQQVMRGAGIPIHRHYKMDETFYVLEGSGTLTLDDVPHPFAQGSTLYIPKNTWHTVVALEPSISLAVFGLTALEVVTVGAWAEFKHLLHRLKLYRWRNCVCHNARTRSREETKPLPEAAQEKAAA